MVVGPNGLLYVRSEPGASSPGPASAQPSDKRQIATYLREIFGADKKHEGDEFGDSEAKKQFKKRLHEEEKHLLFVRRTLLELTKRDVSVPPPSAPAD